MRCRKVSHAHLGSKRLPPSTPGTMTTGTTNLLVQCVFPVLVVISGLGFQLLDALRLFFQLAVVGSFLLD